MNEPLMYKPDLERALRQGCDRPECAHHHEAQAGIFLTPRCHQGAGVDAAYYDGTLHLFCHVCDTPIVHVAVAEYPEQVYLDALRKSLS